MADVSSVSSSSYHTLHTSSSMTSTRAMAADEILKHHLEQFLNSREPPKTFCPSEVARALDKDELSTLGLSEWREAMQPIRELAWHYRSEERCEILQKGEPIDDSISLGEIKGPIRIRRK